MDVHLFDVEVAASRYSSVQDPQTHRFAAKAVTKHQAFLIVARRAHRRFDEREYIKITHVTHYQGINL